MWSFTVFDEKFAEKQLTLDDYIELEQRMSTKDTPVTWREIHPIRSARSAKFIAAYMYSRRVGITFEDSFTKVGEVGALDFIDGLDLLNPGASPEDE